MVKLVLFDIDGTLIHTHRAGVRAFGCAFHNTFGIDDATDGVRFAGRTDTGILREICQRHRVMPTLENFRRFFDAYVFWLEHLLHEHGGGALPGVGSFLDELRQLPEPPVIGLLTGNVRLGAEIKLRHFALWEHFTLGAFGDDHENRNELAAIAVRRGRRLLNRHRHGDDVLVIGDTPLDIECAHAIGARCLAVATGGVALDELKSHRARWVVEDLRAIGAKEVCR